MGLPFKNLFQPNQNAEKYVNEHKENLLNEVNNYIYQIDNNCNCGLFLKENDYYNEINQPLNNANLNGVINITDANIMRNKLLAFFKTIGDHVLKASTILQNKTDEGMVFGKQKKLYEIHKIGELFYVYGASTQTYYGADFIENLKQLMNGIDSKMQSLFSQDGLKITFGFGTENMWRVYYLIKKYIEPYNPNPNPNPNI